MDWKPKLQFPNFYPNLTLSPLNLIKALFPDLDVSQISIDVMA